MTISYVKGDVLASLPPNKRVVIAHVCNDIGYWGGGFTGALSKKWKQPEERYRSWYDEGQYTVAVRPSKQPTDLPDADTNPSGAYTTIEAPPKTEKVIPFRLGMVQYVQTEEGVIVANMIGQHKVVGRDNPKPIKYSALLHCIERVEVACRGINNLELHCPKFGAGLAQGNWDIIEEFIKEVWLSKGLKVYIYEL